MVFWISWGFFWKKGLNLCFNKGCFWGKTGTYASVGDASGQKAENSCLGGSASSGNSMGNMLLEVD